MDRNRLATSRLAGSVRKDPCRSSISITQIQDRPGDMAQGHLVRVDAIAGLKPSLPCHEFAEREARSRKGRPVARWHGRAALRAADREAAVAGEPVAGHLAATRERLPSSEGRTGVPAAAAGTGPDRQSLRGGSDASVAACPAAGVQPCMGRVGVGFRDGQSGPLLRPGHDRKGRPLAPGLGAAGLEAQDGGRPFGEGVRRVRLQGTTIPLAASGLVQRPDGQRRDGRGEARTERQDRACSEDWMRGCTQVRRRDR